MKTINKIRILYNTLKYLKPQQIWFYLIRRLIPGSLRIWLFKVLFNTTHTALKNHKLASSYGIMPKTKCDLLRNKFSFLGKEDRYEHMINWKDSGKEKLWLYNLHYFDYLIEITGTENLNAAKRTIANWIKANPTGSGIGWEPYPLSLRLVNWLFFFNDHENELVSDQAFLSSFVQSLYAQAVYLDKNLELHLQANHLLVNLKAMLFAAYFLGKVHWINRYSELFREALQEQIQHDGGHYEKSPMYHGLILKDIMDILNLIKNSKLYDNSCLTTSYLHSLVVKMLKFYQAVHHDDGFPALLGDTAFHIAPKPDKLVEYLKLIIGQKYESGLIPNGIAFRDTGYYILKSKSDYLIFDAGQLGVDYQPGHAHCDLQSFEYSHKGKRFIVDSGIGNYLPSKIRSNARSIWAHNTVVVNSMDQAQIWSAFRMGKRVVPGLVEFDSEHGTIEAQYENNLIKRKRYEHKRRIKLSTESGLLIKDSVSASHVYDIESLLHIHPDVEILVLTNKIQLERDGIRVSILYDSKKLSLEKRNSNYFEEYGQTLLNTVLVFRPTYLKNKIDIFIQIKPEN